MAFEIYRQEIVDYSARSPDLMPPKPHYYVIITDESRHDRGQLRVDLSAYDGSLTFAIEEPDPEELKEGVTIRSDQLEKALRALCHAQEVAA